MSIIDFYSAVLKSYRLEADEEGIVRQIPIEDTGKKGQPVMVSKKKLVLPTKDVLKRLDHDRMIAFHPMCESATRGESPIIKFLVKMTTYRLQSVLSILMEQITHLAADTATHAKLSPTQQAFLSVMSEADEKTLKALVKVIDATDITGDNRLVSLFLKRDGSWKKDGKAQKCYRLCVVGFPMMEEEESPDASIFGVKMRHKDKQMILRLFEYLLPTSNVEDNAYTFGSDSLLVPYFHSLLGSFSLLAATINMVTDLLKDHLDDYEQLHIDLDWLEDLHNLGKYHDLIPVLEGNDGVLTKVEAELTEEQPAAPAPIEPRQPATLPPPPSVAASGRVSLPPSSTQAPVHRQPPAQEMLNWSDVVRQQHTAHQPPPPPPSPYGAPGYGYPQQQGYGGYGGYAYAPPPPMDSRSRLKQTLPPSIVPPVAGRPVYNGYGQQPVYGGYPTTNGYSQPAYPAPGYPPSMYRR